MLICFQLLINDWSLFDPIKLRGKKKKPAERNPQYSSFNFDGLIYNVLEFYMKIYSIYFYVYNIFCKILILFNI